MGFEVRLHHSNSYPGTALRPFHLTFCDITKIACLCFATGLTIYSKMSFLLSVSINFELDKSF